MIFGDPEGIGGGELRSVRTAIGDEILRSGERRLDCAGVPHADTAAVLAGDMNLWGPPLRHLLPGWRQAVKGRTWPAARPHSQIDHILVRGNVVAASSRILPDAGSDHRPVRAELALR